MTEFSDTSWQHDRKLLTWLQAVASESLQNQEKR